MTKKQKIVYLYFLLLPFIDLITSLLTRFGSFKISLGMIVKGLTLILGVIYIFFYSKCKYKRKSIIYIFLLALYYAIYIFFRPNMFNLDNIINEIIYAFRYFYFPLMLLIIINVFSDFKIDKKLVTKIISINLITYTILLFIPYISGTSFNSYSYDSVFGKNGWFYSANEIGVIMIILLSGITSFLNVNKKYLILFTIPILFSIAIIGTKVSYLGMILVTFLVILFNLFKVKKSVKFKKIILSTLLLFILIFVLFFSPTYTNLRNSIDRNSNTSEKEEDNKDDIVKVSDFVKNKDLALILTVSLNGREKFFVKNLNTFIKSPVYYKLYGLGWSDNDLIDYNYDKKLIEIDYLDILLHYGFIGFIIYFLPLIYFLIKFIIDRKYLVKDSYFYGTILLLVLAISSFAGHVLAAPAVSIYVVILIQIILNSYQKKCQINKNEITILALHLGYGGIEQYLSSLCKMLENNFKINIISTYKVTDKPAFPFSKQINISYLIDGKPNKEELLTAIKNKKILKIIKELSKSVIILFNKKYKNIKAIKNIKSKYIITTREYHSLLVGKYAFDNIIKIATEHNPLEEKDKKYINKLIKSLSGFDYFVVVSKKHLDYYKMRILPTKCVHIPNVIDNLPEKESLLNENNIINIGRLEKEKGQLELIDIVYEIKKTIPNIKLYLIGDGSLKNTIKDKIKSKNLTDNVLMLGFLPKQEIEKYMIKSKLYVMTSYNESFGLVLLEAMSYKVPCISFSDIDGARELLSNSSGILIKRDKLTMANEIIRLLNDSKELKKYSVNGYNSALKYLPENIKNMWLDILK